MTKKKTRQLRSTRDAFGEALLELGKEKPDLVVLSADLNESTRVKDFADTYPERFIQVGVAEQNMASLAVGIALSGKIPIITSFGVFSPGKNWDQIRIGVCQNNANVKIISTHTGLSADKDGATHQALEDIALMRVLPNMTVLSPSDYEETKKVVKEGVSLKGPVYIRLSRAKTPQITKQEDQFEIGNVTVMEEGTKVALVGTGPILSEGLAAAQEINEKYPQSIKVINAPTIKPLDIKNLEESLGSINKVITLEEHQIAAGFGGMLCEMLTEKMRAKYRILRLGMKDSFGESGSYENLKKKYKLNKESIKKVLVEEVKNE